MTTPPDQPEDAALRQEITRIIPYSWHSNNCSIWNRDDCICPTFHEKLDELMQLFREHERQAVQAAEASGAEKLAALLKVGAELTDSVNIDQALRIFKATQPPAADTTKQGEGESDE